MKAKAIKKARARAIKERESRIKKSQILAEERYKKELADRKRQNRKIIHDLKCGRIKLKPLPPEQIQKVSPYKRITKNEVSLDPQTTPKEPNNDYTLEGDPKWA